MKDFGSWFARLTSGDRPYPWQAELGAESICKNRLIRIPTGFGKTLGVFGAWAYHRLVRKDDAWPRRLVWCFPMRVLVEQTEDVVRKALTCLNMLWDGQSDHAGKVGVHLLMGGTDSGDWHLYPEECAVLIGTQDMLISRALNRGYAAGRARWPMEFGVLNQDCLWVMDEVQLMDVGLATGAQIQSFRDQDASRSLRPCATWWMSATLQPSWLISVDTQHMVKALHPGLSISAKNRKGHLWEKVAKPCRLAAIRDDHELADQAAEAFREYGRGKLSLVVVNTVDRARLVHQRLTKNLKSELKEGEIRLIHSRFRPAERKTWRDMFLRRDAPIPPEGRIIVATQVVEAGVDLDAALLITDLAPWPSLVQRFGRSARGGGKAHVIVADRRAKDDKEAAPYALHDLESSRKALKALDDVAPIHLEDFEDDLSERERERLYPYQPRHLLLRHEWDELFDTTPDLTGADLDISRFIRSGDERDLQVFWEDIPPKEHPSDTLKPCGEALCAVPFLEARKWLCGPGTNQDLTDKKRAWVWDWVDGQWRGAKRADMLPGRILLVDSRCGGYDVTHGWDPDSTESVPAAKTAPVSLDQAADASHDGDPMSVHNWKTIAEHGADVARVVVRLAKATLGSASPFTRLLDLAARWHDVGKAHPAFQGSIHASEGPSRQDWAKAPDAAWVPKKDRYRAADNGDCRPGLRHELASALALFDVLRRRQSDHAALLGPWRELLNLRRDILEAAAAPTPEEKEILGLSAQDFDLLVYLVACHHGKVRLGLHASPADQNYRDKDGRGLPIRGVREGDVLPRVAITPGGSELPEATLTLEPALAGLSPVTGASWAERTIGLLARHGPAALAYLEACLRAADIRASREGGGQ
jgi:CRISPR-associated endonuclease/helicase Cas3